MADRKYPYVAWHLPPSFKPKQLELVSNHWEGWDKTASGSSYRVSDLYSTLGAAIEAGRARLRDMEEDLAKRKANLDKRREQIEKAAKGASHG